MASVQRIVLDILKPHVPNALEFASAIADQNPGYRVKLVVEEMDEKTESILLTIEGDDIQMGTLLETIKNLGGSLHSIDEVEVVSTEPPAGQD